MYSVNTKATTKINQTVEASKPVKEIKGDLLKKQKTKKKHQTHTKKTNPKNIKFKMYAVNHKSKLVDKMELWKLCDPKKSEKEERE